MVSGSAMKALKTVARKSGETTTRLVSRELGIDNSYATVLCNSLLNSEHLAQKGRGRFRITSKGKKALGWPAETTKSDDGKTAPLRRIQREEFHWRSLKSFPAISRPIQNGFPKSDQEELSWRAVNYGGSRRGGPAGSSVISLINEKNPSCGCCRGSGKGPKTDPCPVCRGTGRVSVVPPAVSCAFCMGSGMERRTGRTCPVCRGKGVVSVRVPVGFCSHCKGSGMEQGTGLTCLKCSGKGVVHLVENAGKGRALS